MSDRTRLFTTRGLLEVAAIVGSILLTFAIDAAWESSSIGRASAVFLIEYGVEWTR